MTVFESWASPPLISPGMYRDFVFLYEFVLVRQLKRLGVLARPIVIGGDTSAIIGHLLETDATLLISDYNAPLSLLIEKARATGVPVRANIDPKQVRSGSWDEVLTRVREIRTRRRSILRSWLELA